MNNEDILIVYKASIVKGLSNIVSRKNIVPGESIITRKIETLELDPELAVIRAVTDIEAACFMECMTFTGKDVDGDILTALDLKMIGRYLYAKIEGYVYNNTNIPNFITSDDENLTVRESIASLKRLSCEVIPIEDFKFVIDILHDNTSVIELKLGNPQLKMVTI